jgi:hypothetical protein
MDIKKLSDRVKQLVDVTEQLLKYSKELKVLHDKYCPQETIKNNEYLTSEIPTVLRFLHVLFFFDALLNINTLLDKLDIVEDKKEQSFYELVELITDITKKNEIIAELDTLRNKLQLNNLDKFRHKLVAHKDIESAGDSTIMYMEFVKSEFIDICQDIITELIALLNKHFDVYYNNLFEQLHNKGFFKMIELFERELKNENI